MSKFAPPARHKAASSSFRVVPWLILSVASLAVVVTSLSAQSLRKPDPYSDASLVKQLPGFVNEYANVNGVRIHYVSGGSGSPLLLIPGHPETWWAYHGIMPKLAQKHRVIAVDVRGMGTSGKPASGYDKRTMAQDLFELTHFLNLTTVDVVGHDIGAMVAFSFAANHPNATRRLVLLDVPHPDESWYQFPMLPKEGAFGAKIDAAHPVYPWWFAFHQVEGLDEKLLAGDGMREYIRWLFNYMMEDPSKLTPFDFSVYSAAYSSPDGIRCGHAWYRAWPKDIEDQKTYSKLAMPVLGLGAPYTGFQWLQIEYKHATNFRLVKVEHSGHFMVLEQPQFVADQILQFLQ